MGLVFNLEKDTKNLIFKVQDKDGTIYEGTLRMSNSTLRNNINVIKNYFLKTYNHSDKSKEIIEDFFIKVATGFFNSYSISVNKKLEVLHNVTDAIYEYLVSILRIDDWYKHANVKKEEVPLEMIYKIIRYISSIIVGAIIFDSYRNLSILMYERHKEATEFLRYFIISKTVRLNSFSQYYFYNLFAKDETDIATKTLNFINLMYAIVITKDLDTIENFFGFLLTTYKKSLEKYEQSYINTPIRPEIVDEIDLNDDLVTHLNTEISLRYFIQNQNSLFSIKTVNQDNSKVYNMFNNYKNYIPTYLTYLVNNILENLNFSRNTLERYHVLTQYYLYIALKGIDLKSEFNIDTPLRALRYVTRVDTNKITITEKNKIITGILNELQKYHDSVLNYSHHIEKLGKLTLERKVFLEDLIIGKPLPQSENVVRSLVEFMKFYIQFMENKSLREKVSHGLYKNNLVPDRDSLAAILKETKAVM